MLKNEKPANFGAIALMADPVFSFAKTTTTREDPPVDDLISIQEAEARVLAACGALGIEEIPLMSSLDRVLARSITADRPLPPFPRSMMDGVAFNSALTPIPTTLKIAGLHAAGDPPPRPLAPGEAWEIMTGAAIPDDCDTVVPYEDLADGFHLTGPCNPGQCIHRLGSDAAAGAALVGSHSRIGPAEIAIAASVGQGSLQVFRAPRVAILTTGDEAVPVECPPEPWQIRRSNGPMLEAILTRLGQLPVHHGHVSDDLEATHAAISNALASCDVLIICGGISKGKKDHIRAVLESRLGPPAFHGVKLRPGKPLAFWGGPPMVFALPGNPVSVLMTFIRFVLPALEALQGLSRSRLSMHAAGVTPLKHFSWLLPVAAGQGGHLVPCPPRNSGDYVSIAGALGMVEIPPEADFIPGQAFAFHPFP